MMRLRAMGLAVMWGCVPVLAQTHAVKKPETVVRAVAVYEWTGDEAKPTASRLVPVSIFINNQFEDAGVYMVRPVPFALFAGTIFEAQKSGVPEGTVQLAYQRHLEGSGGVEFEDGWMGYGVFKPVAAAPAVVAAKKSGPLPVVVASGGSKPRLTTTTASNDDSSKPTMHRRDADDSDTSASSTDGSSADASKPKLQRRTADTEDAGGGAAPSTDSSAKPAAADDPNRPVLQRRDTGDADSVSASAAGSSSPASSSDSSSTASDANRPTMRRRTSDSTDADTTSTTSSTGGDSSDDVERPTLKKRTAPPKNQKKQGDEASVRSVGSLNDDPDRPTLHRGTGTGGPEIPALNGWPADMRQMVAVSDAKDRPEHDFTRQWDSPEERDLIRRTMQQIAREQLAKYDVPAPAPPAPVAAPAAAAASKTTARTKKVAPPPPPPAPVELADESLRGYTLSYGGAATFVYSATSAGVGGATRYVFVVGQKEGAADMKTALISVTDSTHLERTPWMRLVDVVDAEASNRASLLLELRADHVRQFALYRVIGATAEQVFETGTTE